MLHTCMHVYYHFLTSSMYCLKPFLGVAFQSSLEHLANIIEITQHTSGVKQYNSFKSVILNKLLKFAEVLTQYIGCTILASQIADAQNVKLKKYDQHKVYTDAS